MMELGSRDRDLTSKRLELAAKQRELSGQVVDFSLANNGINITAPPVNINNNTNNNTNNNNNKPSKPAKQVWTQGTQGIQGSGSNENTSPLNNPNFNHIRMSPDPKSDWMRTFTDRLAFGATQGKSDNNHNHNKQTSSQLADSKRTLQVR